MAALLLPYLQREVLADLPSSCEAEPVRAWSWCRSLVLWRT
jgi:hypothetical protein